MFRVRDASERPQKSGFAQPRHALQQHMAARQQTDEHPVNDVLLAHDDFADFVPHSRELAGGKLKSVVRLHRVYSNAAGRGGAVIKKEPDWTRLPQRAETASVAPGRGSQAQGSVMSAMLFRDRLRRNGEDRERYARLKRELATKEWPNMDAYANAKTALIEDIIAAAQTAGEISK
jgi:GrpB protein